MPSRKLSIQLTMQRKDIVKAIVLFNRIREEYPDIPVIINQEMPLKKEEITHLSNGTILVRNEYHHVCRVENSEGTPNAIAVSPDFSNHCPELVWQRINEELSLIPHQAELTANFRINLNKYQPPMFITSGRESKVMTIDPSRGDYIFGPAGEIDRIIERHRLEQVKLEARRMSEQAHPFR